MIDYMHQNGDVARKGAAESRERAKDLKENPQTIEEYHKGERKMSLIGDEISLVQNIPETTTRTHLTSPKNKLDTTPLKGKSAKEVRKAIQHKKELEKVLMNRRFEGTTGPKEPVIITVGAARVVKHIEDQNRRNGTQNNSTNSNNQTPSTSRSAPTRSNIARVSNTSGASVELVTVRAGSQSTGNRSTFYTAPSTPRRRLDSG